MVYTSITASTQVVWLFETAETVDAGYMRRAFVVDTGTRCLDVGKGYA